MSITHGKNASNIKDQNNIFSPNEYTQRKQYNGIKEIKFENKHQDDAQENISKKLENDQDNLRFENKIYSLYKKKLKRAQAEMKVELKNPVT